MLKTRLCELLNIEHPLVQAPLGPDLSGVELVAAVSGAGALGLLQAQMDPPDMLRNKIRRVRELTGNKPFGVNFLLYFPCDEGLAVCLEERVPVVSFFWGDPSPYIDRAHTAGCKVFHQVGSLAAAVRAADVGVDVIVAQGVEAGGHVAGDVATMVLVPLVVDALPLVPVVAAGGIADARGLVAALSLGADGVSMGTRFLASLECGAHPHYKDRVLRATEQDTLLTVLFGRDWPDAPHRVIRTPFVEQWRDQDASAHLAADDQTVIGKTRVAGQEIPLPRFSSIPPNTEARGDIDAMSLLAGQGVGLVQDLKPAATIVQEVMKEAREIIESRLIKLV
jgi:nitronate monooxygenase